MPLLALLKRLVSAEAVAQPQPEPQPQPQPQPQPEPHAQSVASMASLRTQVESERKAASAAASAYRDFTGGGHADAGHWNDPPTVVFKPRAKPAEQQTPLSPSPFVLVDDAGEERSLPPADALVDRPESTAEQAAALARALRRAVDGVALDSASPMVRRMVEDTTKRLDLLDERLPLLDPPLVAAACSVALLIDKGLLPEAADAHRALMQAGYDAELKWLVGIKRVIELRQKTT
ncbi:hypothetical protein H4R18_003592 [Coemansia javaensis]|uniref:SRA1/Sec31 domain-containing protein n=1 Tax=Coemansia javaensis TaxID=2761396 RepID=A0A9W8H8N1_9FUNG|nr:hypothetical protein H4R18_003592 [Coemansia javaensis]